MAPQCARRNVCHDVGRSGTGGRPCAFKIRAMVDRPTRWPTFFKAPRIRVYPHVGFSCAILTTCGMGVVAVVTASSSAFADHVVLKNGDRLTGRVAVASTAEVSLDTELAGRVTIKWTGVAQMNGRPMPADLDLATVRSLVPIAPSSPPTTWHGAMTAGWDSSRGNSETSTLSTHGVVTRLGPRDKLGLFGTYLFSAIGGGTDAVTTARAARGGIRYDHDLAGSLYGFGFGDAESDPLQLLDLRTVVGGGVGAHLLRTEATQFNLFGGVSYARDAYAAGTPATTATTTTTKTTGSVVTPPGLGGIHPKRGGTPPAVVRTSVSRSVGEFLIGQDLRHQLSDTVNVSEGLTVFPAIGDAQDYRVSFDLSLSAQLNGWLQWNVTVADRYLRIPPAGGAVQNDTFISTGLGITFGHGDSGAYTGADGRRARAPQK